ncbi:MAG TPA: type II toxin-antitoxin system VapC family toxin [Terriglobales bacterium]|nr:type II toxin-antitoxin system VapC family toxin [Terriglobales bacterium]
MPFFLDTSALVKLYVREPGTDAMLRLAAHAQHGELYLSALAVVEFTAALRVLERTGRVHPADVTELLAQFREHQGLRFVRTAVNDAVIEAALRLLDRHALRAYDALQLASALVLGRQLPDTRFVCSDQALALAARAEGLDCLDPQRDDEVE